MRVVQPTSEGIAIATAALDRGEIVAYPTETVYGLGVNPFSAAALAGLFEAKGRERRHPMLLVIGAMEHLDALTPELNPRARDLARQFWPGPLSMVLPARAELPEGLLNRDGRVCVRWTSCDIAARLCRTFGNGIVSTSANRSGEAAASCVDEIDIEGIAVAIDGGRLSQGAPSTVYDPDAKAVLREGAISARALGVGGHESR